VDAYIYGAGSMGIHSINVLTQNGVNIKAIIDKNKNLIGKKINNIEVISLNDIPESSKSKDIFAIAVVKFPFNEIKLDLENAGCKNIVYVGDLIRSVYKGPSIANSWVLEDITDDENNSFKFVYENYSDDKSRAAFNQITKWLIDRVEVVNLEGMCDFDSKYFIDEVCKVLSDKEVFIDCGAYDGGSISKMIKYTNNKFDKIYAYEPNSENYKKLERFINEKNISDRVMTFDFGLGNVDGEKKFTSKLDITSRYSDDFGDIYCKIKKLDSVMSDIPYSFLKIYGIGNGLDVIKGGINTIKKYRPIITVNIHHSRDNFVNIPYFLMTNLEEYNFYFRLHGYVGSDAVLYVIPKERDYER